MLHDRMPALLRMDSGSSQHLSSLGSGADDTYEMPSEAGTPKGETKTVMH